MSGVSHLILFSVPAISAYVILFMLTYDNYLVELYGYFGFRRLGGEWGDFFVPFMSILLSLLALPKRISKVSDFLCWQLFVFAFVPIQLTLAFSGTVSGGSTKWAGMLFLSFLIIIGLSNVGLRLTIKAGVLSKYSSALVILIGLAMAVLLTARFASVMSFASFNEIYEQRAASSEVGAGRMFGYFVTWLTYSVTPLATAIALFSGRYLLLIFPASFISVIYSISAAKLSLVLLFMSIFVFWALSPRRREHPWIFVVFPGSILAIGLVLYTYAQLSEEGLLFYVVSQLVMRAIAVQAMIFNAYAEFFTENPFTLYSHIGIVSLFVDYPYEYSLGEIISIHLVGNPDAVANSGFWAMDGIAASGSFGLLAIGFIVGLTFAFFNSMTRGVDIRFSAVAFTGLSMMMINVSLFTTMLTGGGIITALAVRPVWFAVTKWLNTRQKTDL